MYILHIWEKKRTFATIMRLRLLGFILILLLASYADAEVITLLNGQIVQGEVLIQNEEVVIIRNNEGMRFQYPTSEVVSIDIEDSPTKEIQQEVTTISQSSKKTTIFISLCGGAAFLPQSYNGGHVGGELMIGSRYLGKTSIFLGGGLGVHGLMMNGEKYTFLPLQLAIKTPFLEQQHSPYAGATIGYGFALTKNCKGGLFSAIEIGYRYAINSTSIMMIGLDTQFQQSTITTSTTITEGGKSSTYQITSNCNFVTFGAKIGFTF